MKKYLILTFAAAALALTSALLPAHAQTNRMTYQGEMTVPGSNNRAPQNASLILEEPYVAFKARYSHESWILIGTPVHSCEIVWEYVDYQGNPSPNSVTVMGIDVDVTNPDVRFALENHPDIVRAAQMPSGVTFVEARLSGLATRPSVWDLDFLVPVKDAANAAASETFDSTYQNASQQERAQYDLDRTIAREAHTRCLSGALGASGRAGLNTPYSYDPAELLVLTGSMASDASLKALRGNNRTVGRFVKEAEAKRAFEYITRTRDHSRTYRASGNDLVLVDVATDPRPVIDLVNRILREAANSAEETRRVAEERIEADRQAARAAQEEADRLAAERAEAQRQAEAARLAQQRMATQSSAVADDDPRRFDPDRKIEDSISTLSARISDRFAEALAKNNPVEQLKAQSTPVVEAPVQTQRPVSAQAIVRAVNVRFDSKSNDISALEAQARSLWAASNAFAGYASNLQRPQKPRDMKNYAVDDELFRLAETFGSFVENCGRRGSGTATPAEESVFIDGGDLVYERRNPGTLNWRRDRISLKDIQLSFSTGSVFLNPIFEKNATLSIYCASADQCIRVSQEKQTGSTDFYLHDGPFNLFCDSYDNLVETISLLQ